MRRGASGQVLQEVGRRIRGARTAAGLTQEEAAAKAGLDWRRWQRLEAGTVNATVRTLERVASALDVGFFDLLSPRARR